MRKKILASMVAMALSGAVMAEDTSSTIRGKITGPDGGAAANTKVIIVHVPSGTRKIVTTSASGNFNAAGLRVGGPYTITIDSDTYADQSYDNVFLMLGEVERLNAQLESIDSNTITVTGSRLSMAMNNGSGSYFGEQAIKTQSGITRDIKDVVRANPLAIILTGDDAALTIAGMNPKFNSFTVDGISQNDDFGLNNGGNATQRSPLPIDALEQVTVEVAPFDAKVSGFSGGLINAVFKSGTNELHGGVWYEKLSSDWAGTPHNSARNEDIDVEFEEKSWGLNLDGALIKDTLFFNFAYEFYESPQTLEFGAAGSGAANETDATLADLAEVQRIARDVYGLSEAQVGSDTGSPIEEDEKWVLKLDWNINENHRAAFSYQSAEGNRTRNTTSFAGELRLSSHWYNVTEELSNFTVKLYSDWTDDFSSEISFTSKEVANRQVSFGEFADVTIQLRDDDGDRRGRIAFGSDRFRHANVLDTTTDIFKFDGTYLMDEHTIEFGLDISNISIQNLFVPSSKGVINFDSLADFENRIADYTYANGTGNDPFAVGADFDRQTLSFYLQDNWTVSDKLDITIGMRYETLSSDDKPPFNEKALIRTGFDNSENLDGIDIWLPRVGITYAVNENLTIRGGGGRFTGGQPNVWISNAYSENGVNSGFYSEDGVTIDPDSITNIYQPAFDAIQNAQSDGNVSFTDPNFVLPSDWRYQIAADYDFDIPGVGDDFRLTVEALYIKKTDSAFWVDASLHDAEVTTAADGQRLIYTDNDVRYDTMLTNSNIDGISKILVASLSKSWDNGMSMTTSYTNQDIEEVNPGTSSTGRSNFRFSDGINRNDPASQLGRGNFEVEHRFVLNLGYNTELFEGYKTNVNLFLERRTGNPISYLTSFDSSVLTTNNPDGTVTGLSPEFTSGDYTSYIPTLNDPNVVYTDPALEAELLASIKAKGLSGYAGGFAPKKTGTAPWVTNMDLSINQEIPGLFEGHKGVFTIIIDNFINLLDSSQGKVVTNNFGSQRLYQVDEIDAQGRYVINGVPNDTNAFQAEASTWKIKLGVRYTF